MAKAIHNNYFFGRTNTYVYAGQLNKQHSLHIGVVVEALSLSNNACFCASKLSVVGTIPWF